jgi:cell wall-associated NlpC family hydrolase
VLLALAGLAAAGVLATPSATPSAAAAPATAADAAALMAARAHDLEKVTESFDTARDQLAAQTAAAQAAEAKAKAARAQLAAAQQAVRGIARSAYTGQTSAFKALLTSSSAQDFVDQVSTLQSIAGHQSAVLDQAATIGATAAAAQATAEKTVTQARATYDAVAAQQKQLQAQVDQYQADFNRLSAAERARAVAAATTATASRASRTTRAAASSAASMAAAQAVGPVAAPTDAARIAVQVALSKRGDPYIWAAAGPSAFDCSGLMQFAYRAAGIALPHSAIMQSRMGTPVARSALQPGDLVFFYSPVSHVGMYIGNGDIVQAPTSGDVVKITPLAYMPSYAGARRVAR